MYFGQLVANLVLGERIICITIKPAFAGLSRGDDWMATGVRMLAGVLVWRTVAA